jgi:tRNA(Ile)-lysidine synthase
MEGPGRYRFGAARIGWEEKGKIPAGSVRRIAAGERGAVFNRYGIRLPLSVRPLKAGDRIRPYGLDAEKKVKEIMIDRKVPREERWGRPAVCDAEGTILWIPGVVRSAHAPVTASTRRTAILLTDFPS